MKYVIWTIAKAVYLTQLEFTFSLFFKRFVLANYWKLIWWITKDRLFKLLQSILFVIFYSSFNRIYNTRIVLVVLIWYSIYVYNIVWDKHQKRKPSVRPIHWFSPFYILWKLWNTERLWSINFDNISAPERLPMRIKITSKHYYRMWAVIGQCVYTHSTYVVKNASEV